jgi:hypothetical protein
MASYLEPCILAFSAGEDLSAKQNPLRKIRI